MEWNWGFRNKSLYLFWHLWSIDLQQRCQCNALGGKDSLCNKWWRGQLHSQRQKDHSLDPYLTAYIKFNSNLIIDLDIRAKIIRHLEDNIGENLKDLGLGKDFIDMMPQIWPIKEQIDKLDFIKLKNLCASQDTIKNMKRQATDWVNLFANTTSALTALIFGGYRGHTINKWTNKKNIKQWFALCRRENHWDFGWMLAMLGCVVRKEFSAEMSFISSNLSSE